MFHQTPSHSLTLLSCENQPAFHMSPLLLYSVRIAQYRLQQYSGGFLYLVLEQVLLERIKLRKSLSSPQSFWLVLLEFPDLGPEEDQRSC